MDKQTVRERMREKRQNLTSKDIEEASAAVYETALGLPAVKKAGKLLLYSHFDNEIKTAALTGWLLYQGKEVYLPAIARKNMYAINIKNGRLEMSKFGMAQPRPDSGKAQDPAGLDVVIVPGIAFDREMNRLGFGFGYYDSFLAKAKKAVKIALAYDFQVVESIPAEAHDIKMDMIITPDGVIKKT